MNRGQGRVGEVVNTPESAERLRPGKMVPKTPDRNPGVHPFLGMITVARLFRDIINTSVL